MDPLFFSHCTHNLICRTVMAKHMRKVYGTSIIEKKTGTSTYLKIIKNNKIKKEIHTFG